MRKQRRTLAKLLAMVMVITTMLGSGLTSVTAYAEELPAQTETAAQSPENQMGGAFQSHRQ